MMCSGKPIQGLYAGWAIKDVGAEGMGASGFASVVLGCGLGMMNGCGVWVDVGNTRDCCPGCDVAEVPDFMKLALGSEDISLPSQLQPLYASSHT